MKITIEPTNQTTQVDGVLVRLWRGVTSDGVGCSVFVHRIAVNDTHDAFPFAVELQEQIPPDLDEHVPFRRILAGEIPKKGGG
jgi:hypothetical protein